MNRVFFLMPPAAAALPLLADVSVKAAALLTAAAVAALLLRRASASARHVVWLAAVLALLLLPLLSAVLPGWRILPAWAAVETPEVAGERKATKEEPRAAPVRTEGFLNNGLVQDGVAGMDTPGDLEEGSVLPATAVAEVPAAAPSMVNAEAAAPAGEGTRAEHAKGAAILIWAAGCLFLLLRLAAAHWLLRRASHSARPAAGELAETFAGVVQTAGLRRLVRLLLDDRRTVPVAWGVWHPHLLLPAEAVTWEAGQLRSVLMHELAHLRRRDPLVQWLTQIACALHWFNPLVWVAAWRLHVERERACDDLVLSSGVRPSDYAGHLLHVATRLSPLRWTAGCGLAMARRSSLEGRLLAVLSDRRNRKAVTFALTAAAALSGAAIAVPVAMLRARVESTEAVAATAAKNGPAASEDGAPPAPAIDWAAEFSGSGCDYNPGEPFVAAELTRLAALKPRKADETRRLSWLIARAGAEKAEQFRYLLDDPELKKDESLALALGAYDYSVNRNEAGLDFILTELAKTRPGSDAQAAVPLGFIDEWDRSVTAHLKHFAKTDGAGGLARVLFWMQRQCLFPESLAAFRAKHPDIKEIVALSPRGLVATELKGTWTGEKDGVSVTVSFPWEEEHSQVRWEVKRKRSSIAAAMSVVPEADGGARFVFRKGLEGESHPGRLVIEDGRPVLQIMSVPQQTNPEYPNVSGLVLTQQSTAAAPETPAPGSAVPAGLENSVKWSEPVNGLRAALVFRSSAADPDADTPPELHLLLQNVSPGPVRFSDTLPGDNVRYVSFYTDERLQSRLKIEGQPTQTDVLLQPKEGVFLLLCPRIEGERRTGRLLAEEMLADSHLMMSGQVEIGQAPVGAGTGRAWTGKLKTAPTSAYYASGKPQPKDKDARTLFNTWIHHARLNGNLPGGLIGRVKAKMEEFIRNNTGDASGDAYAVKMKPLLPRLDATRDWTPAEVVQLFDDISAVSSIPLDTTFDESPKGPVKTGALLPAALTNAPWGLPQADGLRLAWLPEPQAAEYAHGTELKARLLFYNSGKETVVFRTRTWHQPGHTAMDGKGAGIKVDGIYWTTRGRFTTYRLAPGEYVEVNCPGVRIGAERKSADRWPSEVRVGSWVQVTPGDEVTLQTAPVPLYDWNEKPDTESRGGWWLELIRHHLAQDSPVPASPEERKRLVYRAGREIFGTPISAEEIDAFVNDNAPGALDALAERFAKHPRAVPVNGDLTSGSVKFRVLPPDAEAEKKPHTARNPGEYPMGGRATLAVTRRGEGERIVNEARLTFPGNAAPAREPYPLTLPDGYDTWAAVWEPGTAVLWIGQRDTVRRCDFSDAAAVKEERSSYGADGAFPDTVPAAVRKALSAALFPEQEAPAGPAPAAPAGGQ